MTPKAGLAPSWHLAGFALCAFALSWACWLPLVLLGPQGAAASPLKYLHLLGSLGPALSGLLWAYVSAGPNGLRQLLARIAKWRVAPLWHVLAWGSPFLLLLVAQLVAGMMGAQIVLGTLGRSAEYPALSMPVYWLAILVFYGFGEEIGWRGFALPLLQSRLSPLLATLVVTAVWAVWHWPLFVFSPGMSSLGLGGLFGWLFSLVTGAFILTFLFNGARGSVLIVAAFHATMDIAFLGPPEVMMVVGGLVTIIGVFAFGAVIRQSNQKVTMAAPPVGQNDDTAPSASANG